MKLPNLYWIGAIGVFAISFGYFLLNYSAMAIDGTGLSFYHTHMIEVQLLLSGFPMSALLAIAAFLKDFKIEVNSGKPE